MNDLEHYMYNGKHRLIHKMEYYFDIYEKHLCHFRGKRVNVLEMGIGRGGSLQMWKYYFGEKANVYGVDINPSTRIYKESRIEIFIGDQADTEFLKSVGSKAKVFHVIIDDAGHDPLNQSISFNTLYPFLSKHNGVYICEDLYRSYAKDASYSFVQFVNELTHSMNAWPKTKGQTETGVWYNGQQLEPNCYTKTLGSIHLYDNMVVVVKQRRKRPKPGGVYAWKD